MTLCEFSTRISSMWLFFIVIAVADDKVAAGTDRTACYDIFAVADANRRVLFRIGVVRFKLDKTTGG